MVIGFDAKRAFCNFTGLGNYSRMVIGALASSHPEDSFLLYTPRKSDAYAHCFDGFEHLKVVEPDKGLGKGSLWRSLGIPAQLQRDGVEIYHGLSHELPYHVPDHIAQVVTIHDLSVWRFPQYYPFLDRRSYQLKQRYACEHADAIVAVSQQTKKDVVELLGVPETKVFVVGQSCHPQFLEPVSSDDQERVRKKYALPERYVICVGTVEERKNQIAAVKAMARVDADLALVIVGHHQRQYSQAVKEEVSRLAMGTRVSFVEDADFADFPALYSNAVCSLYLSVFEGFGIPVLESMCCGVPVVCSNNSSLPEVGGEAALLVDPEDEESVAAAVARLSEDAVFRTEMVERSYRQAACFSKEKIANDLYDIYLKVLEGKAK